MLQLVRIHQERLSISAPRPGLHSVTREVATVVKHAAMRGGLCTIFIRHTSASLVIQENADPSVQADLQRFFDRLVLAGDTAGGDYEHDAEGPDDMPGHIKSALTQSSLSIPLIDGALALGTWQGIYLWEHRSGPAAARADRSNYRASSRASSRGQSSAVQAPGQAPGYSSRARTTGEPPRRVRRAIVPGECSRTPRPDPWLTPLAGARPLAGGAAGGRVRDRHGGDAAPVSVLCHRALQPPGPAAGLAGSRRGAAAGACGCSPARDARVEHGGGDGDVGGGVLPPGGISRGPADPALGRGADQRGGGRSGDAAGGAGHAGDLPGLAPGRHC